MPVDFQDESGARWTVDANAAPRSEEPGKTTLVFTSQSGECRICDAALPEGATWDDVDERIWRTLLRYAEPGPGKPSERS
jgi:hypothetical protein